MRKEERSGRGPGEFLQAPVVLPWFATQPVDGQVGKNVRPPSSNPAICASPLCSLLETLTGKQGPACKLWALGRHVLEASGLLLRNWGDPAKSQMQLRGTLRGT